MSCPQTINGEHEWQSGVGSVISCIHCQNVKDEVKEETKHAESCICNKCMTDEEYQKYVGENTQTSDTPVDSEWDVSCPDCYTSIDIIYPIMSKDEKTSEEIEDFTAAYCSKCKKVFDPFWGCVNQSLPVKTKTDSKLEIKPTSSYYTAPIQFQECKHSPQHIIKSNWNLYAGKKWNSEGEANDFNIVLNLTGSPLNRGHIIPISELNKWESKYKRKYREICLDWPDMGVADFPKEFWIDLIHYFEKKKSKVLMFCLGGHGRTGTAMGIFLVLGLGYKPKDAVDWIRKNYCNKAIETWNQLNYVYSMVGETAPPSTERKDFKPVQSSWSKPPCGEFCVCVTCMTNDEYKSYKESGHKVYPESYLLRQKEKKEKEEKKKSEKSLEKVSDEEFMYGWGG
jgi:protein-tyrosine phosphatase